MDSIAARASEKCNIMIVNYSDFIFAAKVLLSKHYMKVDCYDLYNFKDHDDIIRCKCKINIFNTDSLPAPDIRKHIGIWVFKDANNIKEFIDHMDEKIKKQAEMLIPCINDRCLFYDAVKQTFFI